MRNKHDDYECDSEHSACAAFVGLASPSGSAVYLAVPSSACELVDGLSEATRSLIVTTLRRGGSVKAKSERAQGSAWMPR